MEKRKADALTYQMLPPSVAKVTLTWKNDVIWQEWQLNDTVVNLSVLFIQNMTRIIHFTIDQEYQQKKCMNAQKYDSVTIYFSDLVDFIQMVEESTPAEVTNLPDSSELNWWSLTFPQMVTFLNSFYKMFDSRMSKYDIFKVWWYSVLDTRDAQSSVHQVDTVNDAYMVASGVPEKNGDKHAPEIATMALDLLVW